MASATAASVMQRLALLVDWERAARAQMRVDLSPASDLLARLGDPQLKLRTVHVTGSKGKGSVCALIEAGLLQAGLRVGRYASPHIEHMNERISLMGLPIDDGAMSRALGLALDARDAAVDERSPGIDATWFDVVTAAAFQAFVDAGLDWAVIEVGLGGRLDSTNVVLPEVAVVTNVGLEHTDVLGPTVELIAVEKAGIIKAGRPIVSTAAPDSGAGQVLVARAHQLGAPWTWLDTQGMKGVVAANLGLARATLDQLGHRGLRSLTREAPLSADDLPDAVADRCHLPGRLEAFDVASPNGAATARNGHSIGQTIRVVLDGAHVGFALSAVIEELKLQAAHQGDAVVLLAIGADKDAADIVARLRGVAATVVCTQLTDGRPSWRARDLVALCLQQGIAAQAIDDPREGLAHCLQVAAAPLWVLVTGSLHLVGAVRAGLRAAAKPRLTSVGCGRP